MEDEIKEILDFLKDKDDYIEEYGYEYKRISLEDTKILLDYITNLQEELISANESITWWTNRFTAVEKENRRLKNTMAKIKDLNTMPYLRDDIFKEHLSFILQGEDD